MKLYPMKLSCFRSVLLFLITLVVCTVQTGCVAQTSFDVGYEMPTTSLPTADARTTVKWLINTANLAGRRPSTLKQDNDSQSYCGSGFMALNTITRLQMIRGGGTAVLVMPNGDGSACRCSAGCAGATPFSLGSVELKHGHNNLFPEIQPFPDWRAFTADAGGGEQQRQSEDQSRSGTETVQNQPGGTDCGSYAPDTTESSKDSILHNHRRSHQRITNAVDAFLDDRGRLLWILDTGSASANACFGVIDDDRPSPEADADQHQPPKVFAIDVHTNQVVSVISLLQVWRPGVSCFQYVVAVYTDGDEVNNDTVKATTSAEEAPTVTNSSESSGCADWPLVVVGDAGTNRVLVYSHGKDRFSEIMLPAEEEKVEHNEDGSEVKYYGSPSPSLNRRQGWSTPSVRDILYTVPLFPEPGGSSRLLITYHGCRDVYRLRLQTSNVASPTYSKAGTTPMQSAPVAGTLTVMGQKPCRMVILGTDRRRTDVTNDGFAGGGTTVFFRMENTNDIWSWDTSDRDRRRLGIDERDFRLVRVGKTCRIPVAVSTAPVVAFESGPTQQTVQQLVWMLETNFVDHFAGTTDRMGANAKLQPLEMPVQYAGSEATTGPLLPPLRVQPASAGRQRNCTACSRRPPRCKRDD